MLTLGSLFDGIGGWLLAAQHAGIKPLWRCEIDEYPRAVSEYHFPGVDSYGDIRKVHENKLVPVDIICTGSPCQNLSVAGNRKGLYGSESSLFYESIRILREMRDATNGKYPRFFVWENVTGAFSSNHGNDFRAVLEEIGQTKIPMPAGGKWATAGLARLPLCDIAWRTLDAQYWGVPQRRRRIFLVADFAAEGRCAGKVLFVEQSMSGDFEKVKRERETTAGGVESGVRGSSGKLTTYCLQGSMIGRTEKNGPQGNGINKDVSFTLNTVDRHAVTTYAAQSYSEIKESNKGATFKAAGGVLGGGSENYVKE